MHSFSPNCTLPSEGTNFVSSPPIRGTLQILWSSLSVLILCTWTLQHLNIPPQTIAKTKWQRLRRATTRLLTKVKWMLFNVLSPEWIFTKACLDWISVHQLKVKYAEQAQIDGVPWTDAHTHFANMGGFGITFQDLAHQDPIHDTDIEPIVTSNSLEESIPLSSLNDLDGTVLESSKWAVWARGVSENTGYKDGANALRHAKRILSQSISRTKGLQIDSHNSELILGMWESHDTREDVYLDEHVCMNLLLLTANLWVPDAAQLLEARKLGIIGSLPNVEEDDLEDRSDNNVFVRLLAVGQTSWFILQFLVRFHNGQPNTQLEVMVVAFAVCSIATYYFFWDRPKGAEYSIFIEAKSYPNTGRNILKIATVGPEYWSKTARQSVWISNGQMHQIHGFRRYGMTNISAMIICAIVAVFGAIHCIAWNFEFPTRLEQILWQASSLASIIVPVLTLAASEISTMCPANATGLWMKLFDRSLATFCVLILPVFFIAARLLILVEVFRTLFFQLPGAFETTWLSYLPHFG